MANIPNLIAIAPTQPAASTRTTSQSTQPRYKAPARAGKRNFSSTLDKINAKLDELKQNIKGLQETDSDAVQGDTDAQPVDDKQS